MGPRKTVILSRRSPWNYPVDDVEYWTDGGKGWRVENPEDKTKPYWINRDLCAADADAGFRARKAAELKRDQRREAEGQQQKLC